MSYRLGIDIGTNSIGWCVLDLNAEGAPCGIRDIGARIFKDARDPKSRASLAATRRLARAMRRQRDRRLKRKNLLLEALTRHGLFPTEDAKRKALEGLDPYELRCRGLDEKLSPHEFGRALFHLAQRRGFRSNLKADRKEKTGTTKEARKKLEAALGQHRTLGEFLYKCGVGIAERKIDGKSLGQQRMVRFRPHARGAKVEYDLYPTRAMYHHEFDELWNKQILFGLALDDEAREEIAERIIFFQRDLKPAPVGKCTFVPDDPGRRAPEALPIAQRFRILQELNNLEWIDRDRRGNCLDVNQRASILKLLERQKTVSFDKMRKILGLGSETTFNLESKKRKALDGDKVAYEMGKKERFGERWWIMSLEDQNAVIERLLEEEDELRLFEFATTEWHLIPEQAEAIIDAPLPDRHYRLGRIAIRKMLPGLENGHRYHKAAVAAGYNHAMLPTGEVLDELPYYGEKLSRYMADVPSASDPDEQKFGRIANPTVHVALNQLRRVVNELIQLHGHPGEIVVELARELPLGKDDLRERENEQRNNQDRNEELRSEIKTLLREAGVTDGEIQTALQRGDALLRMRLWKELGKPPGTLCPYTLKPIGIRGLFSHEVHIDHILPFRRTHDDSYSNKTICLRRANEIKKDMSPWEAFHTNPAGYDWERILLQSTSLPKNKGWRFAEDAMKKSKRLDRFGLPKELLDQFDEQNDFLASHLVDTRYIARVTREYLTAVCHPYRVWPITGNTTALLRGKWNLSACLPTHNVQGSDDKLPVRKRRIDHRHHAIDAFVVGCTDRSMLQKVASAADDQRDRLIERMPEPWDGFRDDLRDALRRIVVSFRPDHGSTGIDPKTGRSRTTGALHNDTAYFPISGPHADGTFEVVSRKLISNFESMDEVSDISDSPLRDALKTFVEAKKAEGLKIKDACGLFAQETGIRKVRMKEHLIVIPIRKDSIGHPYKAYKGDSNDYMEIWRLPNGKWTAQTVSTFDANQPQAKTRKRPHPASTFDANQPQAKTRKRPHPAAKLLMRIYNDDLARLEDDDGQVRTMRVVKTSKQTVVLADHFEAGNLKDRDDKTRKANKAAKEGQLIDDRDPDAVLAETGGFAYFSRAASKLRDMKFRKLYVSPSGRVRDPGPPK